MKLLYKLLVIALAAVIVAHLLWYTASSKIEIVETTKTADDVAIQKATHEELVKRIKSENPDMREEEIDRAATRIRLSKEALDVKQGEEDDPLGADKPGYLPGESKNQRGD